MAKQPSRRPEFKLTYLQLVVLSGFCLGCMAASYWLGFYTGTRAGYETAVTSDLAASSKIPINAAVPKEDRPSSVSDVYAKLDGTSPMSPVTTTTPAAKGSDAAEIAAIPKVEISLKPKENDIDAELAETLLSPEGKEANQKADANSKSAAEEVWSSHPASPPAGNESPEKTLGGSKKENMPETAGMHEKLRPTQVPTAVKTIEKAALQEMVKPTATAASEKAKEKEKENEKAKEKEAEKSLTSEGAPTPASGTKIARGWYAQVAAPREIRDAESIAAKLRKSGFPVVIESAKVRGENYYRILVGPESERNTADRLVGQLRRETYLQGEPFVRMAK